MTPTISCPASRRVDRLQGRAAGGDDVLDDHAALAVAEDRPLDAPLQTVLLCLLADKEGLAVEATGQRGAGDGVRAHREAADCGRAPRTRLGGRNSARR